MAMDQQIANLEMKLEMLKLKVEMLELKVEMLELKDTHTQELEKLRKDLKMEMLELKVTHTQELEKVRKDLKEDMKSRIKSVSARLHNYVDEMLFEEHHEPDLGPAGDLQILNGYKPDAEPWQFDDWVYTPSPPVGPVDYDGCSVD